MLGPRQRHAEHSIASTFLFSRGKTLMVFGECARACSCCNIPLRGKQTAARRRRGSSGFSVRFRTSTYVRSGHMMKKELKVRWLPDHPCPSRAVSDPRPPIRERAGDGAKNPEVASTGTRAVASGLRQIVTVMVGDCCVWAFSSLSGARPQAGLFPAGGVGPSLRRAFTLQRPEVVTGDGRGCICVSHPGGGW